MLTGSALILGGQTSAGASEIPQKTQFVAAFSAYALPDEAPILTPDQRAAAEASSALAPREALAEPEADTFGDDGRAIAGGSASYYGAGFAGRRTASGETFNPRQLTAAHRTLPFGSKVRVTNQRNGRSVIVRINDRGPFSRGRVIDLSHEAAQRIGLVQAGHAPVALSVL